MSSPNPIDCLKAADPRFTPLIEQFDAYPVRQQLAQTDVFTALAQAILYQSVSVKAANTVYSRLVQLYPNQSFPSAQEVLHTPESILNGVGLPAFKIRYLKALAQAVLNELPTLTELDQLDDESIVRLLTPIPGIGRWSVQMLLIFQLKRLDVLPVSDLGIRAAVRVLCNLEALPSPATVERIGKQWQPYRTIASWYLWQSRDEATRTLLKAWS